MRRWLSLLAAAIFVALALPGSAQTNFAVSDYPTFLQALATTTNITNFSANARINLGTGQTIQATAGLLIDGGTNNVVFYGSNQTRIFHVPAKNKVRLVNLQIQNGSATQGAAIFNEGSLTVSNCVLGLNTATNVSGIDGTTGGHNSSGTDGSSGLGAAGGAIFSKGALTVLYSTFTNNSAKGGNGGNGGAGVTQFIFGGSGGNGGNGGGASGGAIYSTGPSNYIFASFFADNTCVCGAGGLGGAAGTAAFSSTGGYGGVGGSGVGGAIFCNGLTRVVGCFFLANGVTAGATAPAQASGNNNPRDGSAGGSAEGGALFLGGSASGSFITNSTLLANFCTGGLGGSITSGQTGNAGNGGPALGGGVASGAASVQALYCTVATNFLTGGSSGASNAPAGPTAGAQLYAYPGVIKMRGTIISGAPHGATANVAGVSDGGLNLSSDSSGISQPNSLANRNPLLSVEVGLVTTNFIVVTNGLVVTNVNYPTTNYIAPPLTNFVVVSNALTYPSNQNVFNVFTNFAIIPPHYSYDIITSYTYTNTSGTVTTNTAFTTNFVAGSNGGPTPTLSLSNGSPALNLATGVPGISFPLLDQRFYFRVSPSALGAFDPNGVPGLFVTDAATSNQYTLYVIISGSAGNSTNQISDVTSYSIEGTNLIGTNFIYRIDSQTNTAEFPYYGTNITVVTNAIGQPAMTVSEFVTNIPTPVINGPHALGIGQGATFSAVVSSNVAGLGFQWQLNGTNLVDNGYFSGTTTSNLVLKNITKFAQSNLTVIAGTTLAYCQTSAVFQVFVTTLPKMAFTAPASGARTAADPVVVKGTVTLANTVTNIQLWMTNLNDGSVTNISIPFASSHPNGTWSALVSPSPGTNLLSVWSLDTFGYQSPTVTRKFFAIAPGILTLRTIGPGTITGATDNSKLNIGQTYTLVAHAPAKYLFYDWAVITNGSLAISQGNNPTLKFVMQANTLVVATFTTNIFLPAGSVYNGLFYPVGTNNGPIGIITGLTVSSSGSYTAKAFAWSFQTNASVTGGFEPTTRLSSASAASGTNIISLSMQYFGTDIVGTASSPLGTSPLLLEKMIKTNFTASYTTLLAPFPTNTAQGDGYAVMTNRGGTVFISGSLSDGTAFSQSVGVGSNGVVPLFVPLYSDGGVVSGWVPPTGEMESNLIWIKPTTRTGLFTAGFTNSLSSLSSVWKTTPAISLPNGGTVTLDNVSFAAPVPLDFTLAKGDLLYNTNNVNFGLINPNNGLLTINVTNGAAGGVSTAQGVVMKNLTNGSVSGGGFFLTSTNSGSMILEPSPF